MNLDRYLRYWAAERGDEAAFIHDGESMSWSQAEALAGRLAGALERAGFKAGDRFGCFLPNGLAWCVAFFAALRTGAIFVPLNPGWPDEALAQIVDDAACAWIIATPELYARLSPEPVAAAPDEVLLISPGQQHAPIRYREAVSGQAFAGDVSQSPDSVVTLCYTSGSTGRPKGAAFTHAALDALYTATGIVMGWTSQDRALVVLPLASTGGIIGGIVPTLIYGCRCYIEDRFEPEPTLARLAGERITTFSGGSMFWEQISRAPGFPEADLRALRHGQVGGAPVPRWVFEAYRAKGVVLLQGYGATELAGWAALTSIADAIERPHTCGRALPLCEIHIVTPEGRLAEPGGYGEVTVRGPQLMQGYWNDPARTGQAIVDGWFRTGDLGYLQDGRLVVVDKVDNLITSDGVGVYPAEIEVALSGVPGVAEVVVVGVPDAVRGERIVAVARALDTTLTPEALSAAAKRLLPASKTPHEIRVVHEPLPRLPSGKIARRAIAETA